MTLAESYHRVRPSIVAFCPKFIRRMPGDELPQFPAIIGTGFVAHEAGVVMTNAHVVAEFEKQYRPPGTDAADFGVVAIMFHSIPQGQTEIILEVLGVGGVRTFTPGAAYYGPDKPDIAFVHVKARGLPAFEIGPDDCVPAGTEVATAGFPMGTDALTAPGYLHQITPTLQRGIVSAVLPFECARPHAFTINVMVQGGASGSPVFDPIGGELLGVVYASLLDPRVNEKREVQHLPTNISYVVPSHYVRNLLELVIQGGAVSQPTDSQTIDQMLAGKPLINVFEGGRASQWKAT